MGKRPILSGFSGLFQYYPEVLPTSYPIKDRPGEKIITEDLCSFYKLQLSLHTILDMFFFCRKADFSPSRAPPVFPLIIGVATARGSS